MKDTTDWSLEDIPFMIEFTGVSFERVAPPQVIYAASLAFEIHWYKIAEAAKDLNTDLLLSLGLGVKNVDGKFQIEFFDEPDEAQAIKTFDSLYALGMFAVQMYQKHHTRSQEIKNVHNL